MAIISRAYTRKELIQVMDGMFTAQYTPEPGSWAIYADYLYATREWRVAKIEPWYHHKHDGGIPHIYKVTDQPDEIGAFAAFMRIRGAD